MGSMRERRIAEEVARAIYASDAPSGDWNRIGPDGRRFWLTMAKTCMSVDMWGSVEDCAKRLASWDDVDRRIGPRTWDDRSDRLKDMWMRRAKAGWAALHPSVDSQCRARAVSDT